jgi:8-oxo-dGTP diphosphatase
VTQPTSKPPIVAVVIVQDGRVSLVRRRVPEGSLSWTFPSGKIEVAHAASAEES